MTKNQLITGADTIRQSLGEMDDDVLELKTQLSSCTGSNEDAIKEATECADLAHRHLEDARMRLGKVIQALEDGVSILDNPEVKALIKKIRSHD